MQRLEGRLVYAASDLNHYLECKRLTELETLVADGKMIRPQLDDPQGDVLRRKGEEHERLYLAALQSDGGGVEAFGRCDNTIEAYTEAERQTLEAMRRGVRVIYQATFFDGDFIGRADFLRRVEAPSDFGAYSYEVVDTKLGLNTKPYYLVQICNYSEHLARLQGKMPEHGSIVLGSGEERRFALHDYLAYYRRLKASFLDFVNSGGDGVEDVREYPWKIRHCERCPWNAGCEKRRRDDDHLSIVAGMRRDQIAKLEAAGISRVAELAAAREDPPPHRMGAEIFTKLRRQAGLQVRGRALGEAIYELLPHEPGVGFELLPQPTEGDVFFDMEGDPLYEAGRSLEYLFGCWLPDDDPKFRAFWALDRDQERLAFEAFVDFITERRREYPAMHVYHYANYEKDALRRLAQLHATREAQVDDLLRAEVLVDLYAVVRKALAISEESYSIKSLERFYGFNRDTVVKKGNESIVMFESWMVDRNPATLHEIERYNRDDCRSTHHLREWLLERRLEAMAKFGIELPLRPPKSPRDWCHDEFREGCPKCAQRREDEREEARRTDWERALLHNVLPPRTEQEYALMTPERRTRYLLANLLAYHRREERPAWWAYFDRCENVDQLLEFDKEAIAGLTLREDTPPVKEKKSFVYTYAFPDQFYKLGEDDTAVDPRTKKSGTIVAIDGDKNLLRFKTTAPLEAARQIRELIPGGPPPTKEQRRALGRIAKAFLAGTLREEHPATYDLLAGRDPRLGNEEGRGLSDRGRIQPQRVDPQSVSAVVASLDRSYLFVQGPPGSGKSTIGSQVICDLLAAGKRVAVTSTSHKAIHNLLHKVEECMARRDLRFRGLYKHSATGAGSKYESKLASTMIESRETNEAFDGSDYQLAGGTAWLCAREQLGAAFDYLFIDEAGQVALADALATSLCAKNVVLLGDPSQLAQVSQGRHPLHAADSVLQHLLGEAQTVPKHRGIFLDVSYRMQPEICDFISASMYDGRLHAADATHQHRVVTAGGDLCGLYWMPIEHAGNGSSSLEEANAIVAHIASLRNGTVIDSYDVRKAIVVTPYNAQRRLIVDKLRDAGIDVEVGTVDKFQGQEAAVVFYSMATSSGEDIPRNVEFLFERNRLNVAISRARAACMLLCSPRLLEIVCRTPEQMALANLLCAFAERAKCDVEAPPVAVS